MYTQVILQSIQATYIKTSCTKTEGREYDAPIMKMGWSYGHWSEIGILYCYPQHLLWVKRHYDIKNKWV